MGITFAEGVKYSVAGEMKSLACFPEDDEVVTAVNGFRQHIERPR